MVPIYVLSYRTLKHNIPWNANISEIFVATECPIYNNVQWNYTLHICVTVDQDKNWGTSPYAETNVALRLYGYCYVVIFQAVNIGQCRRNIRGKSL
jgi:hypothetical protein